MEETVIISTDGNH